jgi:hypothetical protein
MLIGGYYTLSPESPPRETGLIKSIFAEAERKFQSAV